MLNCLGVHINYQQCIYAYEHFLFCGNTRIYPLYAYLLPNIPILFTPVVTAAASG